MNKKKVRGYLTLMAIGVILNLGLYAAAHFLHLPMWMDSIGTAFTAFALEPAAGMIVALATNFYQATAFYGLDSLFYYFTGALAALCFGLIPRKKGENHWNGIPVAAVSYIILATLLSGGLTLWRAHGTLDSGWESYFMQWAVTHGAGPVMAMFFGTFVLKVIDGVILACAVPLLYMLIPSSMKPKKI